MVRQDKIVRHNPHLLQLPRQTIEKQFTYAGEQKGHGNTTLNPPGSSSICGDRERGIMNCRL